MKKLLLLSILCFFPTLCLALPPRTIITIDDLMIYHNHQEKEIQMLAIYYTEGVRFSFANELTYQEKLEEEKRRKLAYCVMIEPTIKTLRRISVHYLDGDIKGDEMAAVAIKTSLFNYCSKLVDRGDFDDEFKKANEQIKK